MHRVMLTKVVKSLQFPCLLAPLVAMDDLERKIVEKYGAGKIPSEDIDQILNDAATRGLIERKDIRPQPSMNASELINHISHLKRLFLINDNFELNSDDDPYESLCCSGSGSNGKKVINNVLRAYFEYEKKHLRRDNRSGRGVLVATLISAGIIAAFFVSYTPKPY